MSNRGGYFIPEVDDEVLVAFSGGSGATGYELPGGVPATSVQSATVAGVPLQQMDRRQLAALSYRGTVLRLERQADRETAAPKNDLRMFRSRTGHLLLQPSDPVFGRTGNVSTFLRYKLTGLELKSRDQQAAGGTDVAIESIELAVERIELD